jgi:hypothetical protein
MIQLTLNQRVALNVILGQLLDLKMDRNYEVIEIRKGEMLDLLIKAVADRLEYDREIRIMAAGGEVNNN